MELSQALLCHSHVYSALRAAHVPLVDHTLVAAHLSPVEEETALWSSLAQLILRHYRHKWWEIVIDRDPAGERRCALWLDHSRLKCLVYIEEQMAMHGDEWTDGSRVQVRQSWSGSQRACSW